MRCHHSARPYRDASAPPLTRCAGVVLAKLGASATMLTDLAPNLPLLRANFTVLEQTKMFWQLLCSIPVAQVRESVR